ncbi:MAG TPA: DUF4307 domain-containing protein [Humibacter sp.]|nr:DUF4307 domain-containing protein [Humibacter sp.]
MPEPTASAPATAQDASTASAGIGARYGRTAARKRRDRWLLIGLGAFIVVVMACWTVWAGLDQVNGTGVNADSGADQVVDAQHVKVSFTVSSDAGASVACAIEAQNVEFAVTGWKVVQLPKSSKTTRSFTTTVRTTEPSVSGSLDSCWRSATR